MRKSLETPEEDEIKTEPDLVSSLNQRANDIRMPEPKKNNKLVWYIILGVAGAMVLGAVIAVSAIMFLGISWFTSNPDIKIPPIDNPTTTETSSTTDAPSDVVPNYGELNFSKAENWTEKYKDDNDLLVLNWGTTPKMLSRAESDEILKQIDPDGRYLKNVKKIGPKTEYELGGGEYTVYPEGSDYLLLFKAGHFDNRSAFPEKELYYWFSPALGEGPSATYIRYLVFVDDHNRLVNIAAPGDTTKADRFGLISAFVEYDFFPLSSSLENIKDIKGKQTLLLGKWGWATNPESWFSDYEPYDNALGLQSVANFLSKYKDDNAKAVTPSLSNSDTILNSHTGTVYAYKNGCYRLSLPNGAQMLYDSVPSFAKPLVQGEGSSEMKYAQLEYNMDIDWQKKQNSEDTYQYYLKVGGCGQGTACSAVVDGVAGVTLSNLVQIGVSTKDQQPVYELKDKASNAFYRSLFDGEYGGWVASLSMEEQDKQGKMSEKQKFQQFLDDQPLFFWQDPMGHWYAFKKMKYHAMVECGKPVIYLYPQKEMDVKVSVTPNGGFKKTEPAYGADGWEVRATPESNLFNYADNTTYPYLFWEGYAYNMTMPDTGFVLKKSDVGVQMTKILAKLGLNAKEIKDFLEFWQPKLEVKPYVFVTFVPQAEFDKLAPLTVTPAPDKVIRVFMDYAPLDTPVSVSPLQIKTPVRTGFTVVEWGGRLHN